MSANKTSLIITSISAPNAVMKAIAAEIVKHEIDFIVIGDTKSPGDFKLEGCRFYSVEEQERLPFKLAKLLPKKHYSRKNIGYLLSRNHEIIIETDDDNFPREDFWNTRNKIVDADSFKDAGWMNVYSYFSNALLWPRGFPLEFLKTNQDKFPFNHEHVFCPIQQGLADENPDVDAVYRMTSKLPIDFEKKTPIALGKNSWCPFNSQNTTWFKESFPLLYLPSFCSFRMTDIWRSFIAQRIAWTCGWSVLFHNATVWQDRNDHILLKDFEDEIPGYLNNAKICQMLADLDLLNGVENIGENLLRCYRMMTENKFTGDGEMSLVEAWLKDILN